MKFKVAVVGGAGHIGLPFSCFISNKGIETVIIDVHEENMNKITNKVPPFIEKDLQEELNKAIDSGMVITKDMKRISECNIIFITLGTSSKSEDIDNFNSLVDDVIKFTEADSTILLRSTIAPNTMSNIYKKYSNDLNLRFIYAPERIAEGKAFEELKEMPQIIGSNNDNDYAYISSFFHQLGINTINTSYEEAEFIKLFLNTYRYIQFSTLNFFENIAFENSLDFKKLLNIASKEYPRMKGVPDSGFVGGPCLIKDSKTFSEAYSYSKSIINEYLKVNEMFINNIIERCKNEFNNKKIIQLGITFKPESDDLRDSQAYLLNKKLIEEGFDVLVYDPFIENKHNWNDIKDYSDNVIIATNHSEFKSLNLNNKKVILIGTN